MIALLHLTDLNQTVRGQVLHPDRGTLDRVKFSGYLANAFSTPVPWHTPYRLHCEPTDEILPFSSLLFSSSPSMESPKRKRISYVKAGVLIVDQVKPAILKGTTMRFDLSKSEGIK